MSEILFLVKVFFVVFSSFNNHDKTICASTKTCICEILRENLFKIQERDFRARYTDNNSKTGRDRRGFGATLNFEKIR